MYRQLWQPRWLQEQLDGGASLTSIADDVGCSLGAVRGAAAKLEVRRSRPVQRPELKDQAWLTRAYVAGSRSASNIAAELAVSDNTVLHALRRHAIPVRSGRDARPPTLDSATVARLYVDERMSVAVIAARFGVHTNTVYRALDRAAVPRRPRQPSRRRLGDVQ